VIAFAPWQGLLDGIGWVLARIYDLVPNYGVTIILLTVVIRLILLPLGIMQIRSMHNMQVIQPKVKAIQAKYKGNRQKQQEETMKLYKEHGVNPFSGCWPVLLQFPILIAMYSVVRFPQHPPHLPEGSDLRVQIEQQIPPVSSPGEIPNAERPVTGTDFLYMNLLCSASQAGDADAGLGDRIVVEGEAQAVSYPVDCGDDRFPDGVPYYVAAALMFGTTYYQQRQMQKASPPGTQSPQQQTLLKIMPLMFGVFGFFFPTGLVVYWTTSNLWQIGQQHFMLRSRPTAEALAAAKDGKKPARRGLFAGLMERAEQQRAERNPAPRTGSTKPKPGGSKPPPKQSPPTKKPGSGGTSATRNRKKRPKR
jgi:YidC/Oxa1 family membrane protein insertase